MWAGVENQAPNGAGWLTTAMMEWQQVRQRLQLLCLSSKHHQQQHWLRQHQYQRLQQ
jgi:hypothetical protein